MQRCISRRDRRLIVPISGSLKFGPFRLFTTFMRVTRGIPAAAKSPVALTIGNFDGVHLGHRAMLDELARASKRLGVPSCVMIFEPQPREFFAPDKAPTRLTSLREKLEQLEACGVNHVHVCRFNYAFAQIAAHDFIERVTFVIGKDHKVLATFSSAEDKISPEQKTDLDTAVADLKSALANDDDAAIKSGTARVSTGKRTRRSTPTRISSVSRRSTCSTR